MKLNIRGVDSSTKDILNYTCSSGRSSNCKSVGVRHTDIFSRQNEHSPENELRIFPGTDHPCQPVERRIRIAAEAEERRSYESRMSQAWLDALAPRGIRHVDMPATPDKLWRLIHQARREEEGT